MLLCERSVPVEVSFGHPQVQHHIDSVMLKEVDIKEFLPALILLAGLWTLPYSPRWL